VHRTFPAGKGYPADWKKVKNSLRCSGYPRYPYVGDIRENLEIQSVVEVINTYLTGNLMHRDLNTDDCG